MTLTSQPKCPLCGSGMTQFGTTHSDGEEWITYGLGSQQCTSRSCGLPVRLWEEVGRLKDCEPDVNAYEREIEALRERYEEAVAACYDVVNHNDEDSFHCAVAACRAVVRHERERGTADADVPSDD